MTKRKKKIGMFASTTSIPDKIVQDGIAYYRIYGKSKNVKHIKYMNTKYYADDMPPESVEIDGVTYHKVKPEQPGDNYRLVTTVPEGDSFDGSTYYAWIEIPASVEIDGVTYYLVKPEQPNYKWQLVEVIPEGEEYDGRTYYAWTFDYPEKIELDGVEYYFNQQDKPGDEYVEKTLEYEGHIYYAWVIDEGGDEPELPDSIEIDGVTYYKVQPENPGEGYHLATVDYQGTPYYAWIAAEEDGDEPEPVLPDTIEVDGVTYYKVQPENPGEGYHLATVDYQGTPYYAWIADEPVDPSEQFYFYAGIEEVNQNNYTEVASQVTEYPENLNVTVPTYDGDGDGYDVYVLVKAGQEIKLTSGMFTYTSPSPEEFDGQWLYAFVGNGFEDITLTLTLL